MPPRNILVPVDGSDAALHAVAYADDLADKCGSNLTLLNAVEAGGTFQVTDSLRDLERIEHIEIHSEDVLRAKSEEVLGAAAAQVKLCPQQRVERVTLVGNATDNIVQYAREHGADLIVMGSRGLGNLSGMLLGSVSHKVIQLAHCPCMVVR